MKIEKLVIGILAHVDAGKTTLAESMLYLSGAISKFGRVDHKSAFLDTYELEKLRGITIFSKQAEFSLGQTSVTLLDTPGHVDFSAEMERTLQVLDYAILVINSMDGVQGHVKTLWRLLKRYQIPVFLFVNKMDQIGADQAYLMNELQKKLDDGCLNFDIKDRDLFYESLAMSDETVMESYLQTGRIETAEIIRLIKQRKIFPCYFGSALKMDRVEILIQGLEQYTELKTYPDQFGAKVFKISRDPQGVRLTHLKITGGSLQVKMLLSGSTKQEEDWQEKVDQIRIYSGGQFRTVGEAIAGDVCAVTGLSQTYAGQGLGIEKEAVKPVLEPVLTYGLQLPPQSDFHSMYTKLCQLEEEEPQLHIVWDENTGEIRVQVMGEVQIEILKSIIIERYDTEVEFSTGSIVYKETIREVVEGVGHFEPLRHYAEVHLLIEPAKAGSGLKFSSSCSEDMLDRNWQRLVLTHLQEKNHKGVLTGSEITDLNITLVAGRAHQKHTEGGDFRQATYRAVRNGLKKAESILLEPVYDFVLEIPVDKVGRAMSDLQKMSGTFSLPQIAGDRAIMTGVAPVSEMRDYQTEVIIYSHGEGQLFCSLKGYEPCHNAAEIIQTIGYDSEKDIENPTGSVFCSHGTGFIVEWDHVAEHMHLESYFKDNLGQDQNQYYESNEQQRVADKAVMGSDEELEEIFVRTYGPIKQRAFHQPPVTAYKKPEKEYVFKKREQLEEYLLVDGYNIIFAWEELKDLARISITGARDRLCEILCNYQGYKKITVIVVFDAYKVDRGKSEAEKYHNIFIVYTKNAETADQYIERTVKKIGRKYRVTVATSDALEQMIIWGLGAMRLSAHGLQQEVEAVNKEIRSDYLSKEHKLGNHLLNQLPVERMETDQ